ncbi:MAG: PAS domain S-box protein [Calditrichaeota bacterium]|nr:PAS domain S-box protein [Calditrichota bacterium]
MKNFFLEQETIGALLIDSRSGKIVTNNRKAEEILGEQENSLKEKYLNNILPIDLSFFQAAKASVQTDFNLIFEDMLSFEGITLFASLITLPDEGEALSALLFCNVPEIYSPQNQLFLPKLRSVLGGLGFASILMDRKGNIRYCNSIFAQITGYSQAELIGQNAFKKLIPGTMGKEMSKQYEELTGNQKIPATIQVAINTRDGSWIEMIWNNKILLNKKGESMGIAGIGIDLPRLSSKSIAKEKHGHLEDIIARISSMFAQSPSYKLDECINQTLQIVGEYAQVDRSYVFLFRENLQIMDNTHEWCAEGIEPQIHNLQGIPSKTVPWWMKKLLKHEIIHIPQVSAMPPEASTEKEILDAQDIQSLIVVPMLEGEVLTGFIGFDSVRLPKFWADEDINLLKIISSIFVSSLKRKYTELSLADSERRYRTLFNIAPDLIFILDKTGKITALNPAFKIITGLEIDAWMGKSFSELVEEEERELFQDKFRHCLQGESPPPYEIRLKGKNDNRIVEIISLPLIERGALRGVYGIARDITERRTLEENLRHAERMKSLGNLAGGIAHDFNNILGILLGNYSLLKEIIGNQPESLFPLEMIKQAIDRGKNLVQNLLTFARKKEPHLVVLNLNEEIEHIVILLRQTTPSSIYFELEFKAEKPWIRSDRVQIHQVILNLCLNAIDAIMAHKNHGKVKIITQTKFVNEVPFTVDETKVKRFVHLQIIDDGIGMDEETKKFIFDPFYTTKEGGTGLGLAVVFGVLRSLDGFIEVESQPDQGTAFHLFLPACEEVPEQPKKPKDVKRKIPEGNAHILLVEDDTLLSKMLSYILKRHGYRVTQTYSGEEAIQFFKRNPNSVDLVILDYDLPEKDGSYVARFMKRIDPNVKLLMTSGYIDPKIKQTIESLGTIDLIEKPYEPEMLLEYIPEFLKKQKM